jgi:hypothetical protein
VKSARKVDKAAEPEPVAAPERTVLVVCVIRDGVGYREIHARLPVSVVLAAATVITEPEFLGHVLPRIGNALAAEAEAINNAKR